MKNEFLAIEDIPNIDYDDKFDIKCTMKLENMGRYNGLTASDLLSNNSILLSENINLLKI